MKSLSAIILIVFGLNYTAASQISIGYFDIPTVQQIVLLSLDRKYDRLDSLLKQKGYRKSNVFPKHKDISISESFTYTNDTFCSKTDIRVEVNRKHDASMTNNEYYISFVYYSSFLHESDEKQLKEFLKSYAYNFTESSATGSLGPNQYMDTNTPESIKRSGSLYLSKVRFYILDGTESSTNFCGLQYRIKYDMYFRRGYASLDTIGFVSTKEKSGLRLREDSSLESKIITIIPYNSQLTILEYADRVDVVDGQSGNWCKVRYEGHTGWVWGNYLRAEQDKRTR